MANNSRDGVFAAKYNSQVIETFYGGENSMPDLRTARSKVRQGLQAKDYITIGISCAALMLSGWTALRVVDDVGVVIGNPPVLLPDFKAQQFAIVPDQSLIFINSGTRGIVIRQVYLTVTQPSAKAALPLHGCHEDGSMIFPYTAEPFVVKSGDIVTKTMKLTSGPMSGQLKTGNDGNILIDVSDVNKGRVKYQYKTCLEVAFATPSDENGSTVVDEFADELGPEVGGYLFTREPGEKPPAVLVRKHSLSLY